LPVIRIDTSLTTAQLITAALAQDRLAQRELYERFLPYALKVVRRYGVKDTDLADVVQEVFAEVFAKLNTYNEDKAQFSTWVRTICVRRSVDHLRRRERLRFTSLTAILPQHNPTSAQLDFQKYTNETLMAAIATLPTGYRTVFNLFAVEGYKHTEIAEILDITAAASRSQYTRARRKLQRHLNSQQKKTIAHEYR